MVGADVGVSDLESAIRAAKKNGEAAILAHNLRVLADRAGLAQNTPMDSCASSARRSFFLQRRFLPFVQKLVLKVGEEWLPLFNEEQRKQAFDVFFTPIYSEGAFSTLLALGTTITTCEDTYTLKRLLSLAQAWFEDDGIANLLRASDSVQGPPQDQNAETSTGNTFLSDAVQALMSLPDRIANRLEGRVPPFFHPQQYFSRLAAEAVRCAREGCMQGPSETKEEGGGGAAPRLSGVGALLGGLARGGHGGAAAQALAAMVSEEEGVEGGMRGVGGGVLGEESGGDDGGERSRRRWGAAGMDRLREGEEREAERGLALSATPAGRVARGALRAVGSAWLEGVLGAVVCAEHVPRHVAAALLLGVGFELPQSRALLGDKFLVGRTWAAPGARERLLCAVLACDIAARRGRGWPTCGEGAGAEGERPVVAAMRAVGEVWGEVHFVQYGARMQQEQVSWLLQGCLRHVGGREELEDGGLVGVMVKAIQARMESPVTERREDAKRIAEMFAFRLDPSHPLKFDDDEEEEEEEEDGTKLEKQAAKETAAKQHAESQGALETGKPQPPVGGVHEGRKTTSGARKLRAKALLDDPDRVVLDSDEEEDPPGSDSEPSDDDDDDDDDDDKAQRSAGDAGFSDDSDSDDGLVPYEMDEGEVGGGGGGAGEATSAAASDVGKRIGEGRVPLPTRIRQCLSGLRSQNPDEVEAAVFAVAGVVQASQDLQGEECGDLARVLLRLEDRVAMDDFEGRRHAGLVELCAKDPASVAPRLAQAVWDGSERLGAKLDALQVLSEAAFRLSALPAAPEVPELPSEGEVQAGKTRRWSRKSRVRRAEAKANEFAPLVNVFFFSLISGWDAKTSPRLLGADFVLAGRLIAVMGCFVECAGNSPVTRVLAKALMQLLAPSSVRHHSESYVRRCAQYSLSRVLATLPPQVFVDDFHERIPELQGWLQGAFQEDSDQDVAKMAGGNLYMLNERAALAAPKGLDWW